MFNKENPEQGCFDIPNEVYHSSRAVSRSQLMHLKDSPLHFWYFVLNPNAEPRVETKPMKFGSAFHTYVLEPEAFKERYYIAIRPSGTGMKAEKERQKAIAGHRELLWQDEFDKLKVIAEAIKNNPDIKPLLERQLVVEHSLFWKEPETGLMVKCRPDAIANDCVLDLKSAYDASFYKFRSAAYDGGYHIQAAMIREAFKIIFDIDLKSFILLTAEKTPPYISVPYPMSEELIDRGEVEYKQLMIKLAECMETNKWPGYPPELLTLPNYVRD